MIASLQMYDWKSLAKPNQEYWALVRDFLRNSGINAPAKLTRFADESDPWLCPDLVLSQTCGLPYRSMLHDKVVLVGTADYGVEECPPGHYKSVFVARKRDQRRTLEDFQDSVFTYNNSGSQSGYAAAHTHTAKLGFWFENRVLSGGHRQSTKMIAEEKADIASIDAVSWRFIEKYEPYAERLRVVTSTDPTPGLPYISAAGVDQSAIFSAIEHALRELDEGMRTLLGIKSIVYIPSEDYLAIPTPPE